MITIKYKTGKMIVRTTLLMLFLIPSALNGIICAQYVDSTTFSINTRSSFYTLENKCEFLLHIPQPFQNKPLTVTLSAGKEELAEWSGRPNGMLLRIPCELKLPPANYKIAATIISGPGRKYAAFTELVILRYKANEVKADRLTGGLTVNRRPFFPFGFYCYSPVYGSIQEEEVVKGFNMISPYQTILPENLAERKSYMDRCAMLGMKVHYNLISLSGSGGGGVGSRDKVRSPAETRQALIREIKTFMDHPALLAWYISDEPNAFRIPPDTLKEVYNLVRSVDPWHPVSMVFTAPFLSSKGYSGALDIVMADPYPVPNAPVATVGNVTGQLKSAFYGSRPVWMVIQAFGGGEWWAREPTIQELRTMTWQAVIRGASGIQYFVRQGPGYFPKSVAAWNECGRMALEIAELTPWLLSDEETFPAVSSSPAIIVTSKVHDGQLLIMAVNTINEPVSVTIGIKGLKDKNARLIFENRTLPVRSGNIHDNIPAFGSQVYLIDLRPEKKTPHSQYPNLLRDPGFEEIYSPGIPSACYARPGGDRGATYFLDTREHHEGNHSLRLITPETGKGVTLRYFPFKVKAGASYAISLWARSDPEQRFSSVTFREKDRLYVNDDKQFVEVELGVFGKARFTPDDEWRRYMTFVTIPADTLKTIRINLIIRMPGQGVAWLDELKVHEEQ